MKHLHQIGQDHYIACNIEEEFDQLFTALSESGTIMLGSESVGCLRKMAWVVHKFGITWQPVWE